MRTVADGRVCMTTRTGWSVDATLEGERIGPLVREWVRMLDEVGPLPVNALPVGDLASGTVKHLRTNLKRFGLIYVQGARPWRAELTHLGEVWARERGLIP